MNTVLLLCGAPVPRAILKTAGPGFVVISRTRAGIGECPKLKARSTVDSFLSRYPSDAKDPQGPLVAAAWKFRVANSLTERAQLTAMNVTAWLYTNHATGKDEIYVRRNITIGEIRQVFRRATSRDEVGFHSEGLASKFFLGRSSYMTLKEIFSDRIPCSNPGGNSRQGCRQILWNYFRGIPVYYMYYSYETTEDGNWRVADCLNHGYLRGQQYHFSSVQSFPDRQSNGKLESHYMIYSL